MVKKSRAGAIRKSSKRPVAGSGGQHRKALEGRGPTPKAEDRPYHPAARAAARRNANPHAGGSRGGAGGRRRDDRPTVHKRRGAQVICGRNAVYEALQAGVPASQLVIAERIDTDDRVRDSLKLAEQRHLVVSTVTRQELDRLAGDEAVHQGIALQIPPYHYSSLPELFKQVEKSGRPPLFVALDGVTDPRNLGAIIRSVAAFGGQGVIVPERRSAGVTAATWKTSAGAALRVPVALVSNLNQALQELREHGLFVVGLDGGGSVDLPQLQLGTEPIVLVVGSEGKGLSRLVAEHCDQIVSIPIESSTESLNAGIAAAVSLYAVAMARAAAGAPAAD